jgi:hypothetical protein
MLKETARIALIIAAAILAMLLSFYLGIKVHNIIMSVMRFSQANALESSFSDLVCIVFSYGVFGYVFSAIGKSPEKNRNIFLIFTTALWLLHWYIDEFHIEQDMYGSYFELFQLSELLASLFMFNFMFRRNRPVETFQ